MSFLPQFGLSKNKSFILKISLDKLKLPSYIAEKKKERKIMQTEKPEKVTFLKVSFTEKEFALLVERVGDPEPGAEAQYIHDATMRSLNRKKGKKVEAGQ